MTRFIAGQTETKPGDDIPVHGITDTQPQHFNRRTDFIHVYSYNTTMRDKIIALLNASEMQQDE